MREEWRPVSFAPHIEVSNHGRVRSLDRVIPYADGRDRPMVGRIRKPATTSVSGYLNVVIAGKMHYVHRLVAAAFVQGYQDGLIVNHKDGDRKHNHAENLEWVTHRENNIHARDVLRIQYTPRPAVPVVATNLATGEETTFDRMENTKHSGFSPAAVCNVCKGRYRSHRGFAWRYADATQH